MTLARRGKKITLLLLMLFFLLALAAACWQFGPRIFYRYLGGWATAQAGQEHMAPEVKEALSKELGHLNAMLAWTSSRDGSHQIYLLTIPDLELRKVTSAQAVSSWPRFSPAGDRLLFTRSQREWVSIRDDVAWDVWTLDLQGGQEQLIAPNGLNPEWLDENRITYIKSGSTAVMLKDLASGQEQVLLAADDPLFGPDGTVKRIEDAEVNPLNPHLLTATVRGRLSAVGVVDLAKRTFTRVGNGCQIGWFPDGQRVFWVDNGGNGGNQIMFSPYPGLNAQVFMDHPGQFSHEYFPRLSAGGRWLAWGISAGGHEHDIADYEIFLWDTDTSPDQAKRLTYNSANDRRPDIFLLPQ